MNSISKSILIVTMLVCFYVNYGSPVPIAQTPSSKNTSSIPIALKTEKDEGNNKVSVFAMPLKDKSEKKKGKSKKKGDRFLEDAKDGDENGFTRSFRKKGTGGYDYYEAFHKKDNSEYEHADHKRFSDYGDGGGVTREERIKYDDADESEEEDKDEKKEGKKSSKKYDIDQKKLASRIKPRYTEIYSNEDNSNVRPYRGYEVYEKPEEDYSVSTGKKSTKTTAASPKRSSKSYYFSPSSSKRENKRTNHDKGYEAFVIHDDDDNDDDNDSNYGHNDDSKSYGEDNEHDSETDNDDNNDRSKDDDENDQQEKHHNNKKGKLIQNNNKKKTPIYDEYPDKPDLELKESDFVDPEDTGGGIDLFQNVENNDDDDYQNKKCTGSNCKLKGKKNPKNPNKSKFDKGWNHYDGDGDNEKIEYVPKVSRARQYDHSAGEDSDEEDEDVPNEKIKKNKKKDYDYANYDESDEYPDEDSEDQQQPKKKEVNEDISNDSDNEDGNENDAEQDETENTEKDINDGDETEYVDKPKFLIHYDQECLECEKDENPEEYRGYDYDSIPDYSPFEYIYPSIAYNVRKYVDDPGDEDYDDE